MFVKLALGLNQAAQCSFITTQLHHNPTVWPPTGARSPRNRPKDAPVTRKELQLLIAKPSR